MGVSELGDAGWARCRETLPEGKPTFEALAVGRANICLVTDGCDLFGDATSIARGRL